MADNVFIGGNTAVHQFCRVGEGAMLGGMSGITRDVIPFGFAFGPKADLVGLNVVGPQAAEVHAAATSIASAAPIRRCSSATAPSRSASSASSAEFAADPVIGKIVSFIRDGGKRPLMMPAAGGRSKPIRTYEQQRL